jgi:Transcriptional regulators
MTLDKTPAASARDTVYAALKEQILSLELPPGTPLSENETSVRFQVSRTPVRESFMKLAQEGLMQVLPQRGTYVSLIDMKLAEEAHFMREQLECAVIRLACGQLPDECLRRLEINLLLQDESVRKRDNDSMFELDQQFHRLLFEGCGKLNTWQAMSALTVHMVRSRKLKLEVDRDWRHLYEQHLAMADAIRAGDANAAGRLMKEHLAPSLSDLALLKEQYPHYFS